MGKLLNPLLLLIVFLQTIQCQYISRGANYFHNPYKSGLRYMSPQRFNVGHNHNGYNTYRMPTYRDFDHKFKNSVNNNNYNNYENPVNVEYYYKHKPVEKHWKEPLPPPPPPIPPAYKPDSFVEDYTEDEYTESLPHGKDLGSFISGVSYDKDDNEEHHENDYKEAAGKKFAVLGKHADSGHKEAEIAKVGGYHDKHLDASGEGEHQKFKKDAEYSHDRGHGFIKSWSWDRKHIKGNAEGEKTKLQAEITAGDNGAFGAVAAKGSEGHDTKGLAAVAGAAGYGKAGHEESTRKSSTAGKSDFDKEFPIFG